MRSDGYIHCIFIDQFHIHFFNCFERFNSIVELIIKLNRFKLCEHNSVLVIC